MVMLAVFAVGMLIAHKTRFAHLCLRARRRPDLVELMGVPVARVTIGHLRPVEPPRRRRGRFVFALYTSSGYSLANRRRRARRDPASSSAARSSPRRRLHRRHLRRHPDLGPHPDLHRLRRHPPSWWTKIAIGILLFAFITLQRGLTKRTSSLPRLENMAGCRPGPPSGRNSRTLLSFEGFSKEKGASGPPFFFGHSSMRRVQGHHVPGGVQGSAPALTPPPRTPRRRPC